MANTRHELMECGGDACTHADCATHYFNVGYTYGGRLGGGGFGGAWCHKVNGVPSDELAIAAAMRWFDGWVAGDVQDVEVRRLGGARILRASDTGRDIARALVALFGALAALPAVEACAECGASAASPAPHLPTCPLASPLAAAAAAEHRYYSRTLYVGTETQIAVEESETSRFILLAVDGEVSPLPLESAAKLAEMLLAAVANARRQP